MAYTAYSGEFVPFRSDDAASYVGHRRGLLRRIFDFVFESRCRQAEREVARYLERSGGRMTDDMELRISQRLITGGWDIGR